MYYKSSLHHAILYYTHHAILLYYTILCFTRPHRVSLQWTVFFYIQLQCRIIPSVVLPYCIAMYYDVP